MSEREAFEKALDAEIPPFSISTVPAALANAGLDLENLDELGNERRVVFVDTFKAHARPEAMHDHPLLRSRLVAEVVYTARGGPKSTGKRTRNTLRQLHE